MMTPPLGMGLPPTKFSVPMLRVTEPAPEVYWPMVYVPPATDDPTLRMLPPPFKVSTPPAVVLPPLRVITVPEEELVPTVTVPGKFPIPTTGVSVTTG